MPVMICAKCGGQIRDSFHKEPIGLKKEMSEGAKAIFEQMGMDYKKVFPTKWCKCHGPKKKR